MKGRIDLRCRQQPLLPQNVLFSILIVSCLYHNTAAFSAPNNSPWKSASWQLVLNIGREPSSTLPEEWGKSGARLSFPLEIQVESERLPDPEQDLLLGRGANRLRVVNEESITYITEQGEQQVPFVGGGWKLSTSRKKGHASLLRFWLDLGTLGRDKIVAQKKDVTLEATERLYFAAHGWRKTEWERGRKKIQPLQDAYERAQAKLVDRVRHEDGDRRLDGTDALETLAAYKDMAGLTLDRDDKRRQLQEAQEYLPPPEDLPLGNWPGSTELMALQPMEIFVQRRQGFPIPKEEYHLIGTWAARPLNVVPEEDEYEYYDDDEEEISDADDEYEYDGDDGEDEEEEEEEEEDSVIDTNVVAEADATDKSADGSMDKTN